MFAYFIFHEDEFLCLGFRCLLYCPCDASLILASAVVILVSAILLCQGSDSRSFHGLGTFGAWSLYDAFLERSDSSWAVTAGPVWLELQ